MDALTINFAPVIQITDEQFFHLCQINELQQFERNADGTLLLMPLVGDLTSNRNANLQQFSIKPTTKMNRKIKPSIGFGTFICGTFDCNLL